jgi:MFS superfamily sulfate permease-like transporter
MVARSMFGQLQKDLPASIVVFLVALPLCLGIALASGAPLLSGIVTGIVGGIVVGALSGSSLAVPGPAAGLTVIVLAAIESLGFPAFLTAVMLAGLIQLVLGLVRAGVIGSFIPDAVIKGMLAAIGLILILKQIPHAFGYDASPEGETAFRQADGENTFSELLHLGEVFAFGAILITLVSLCILVVWEHPSIKRRLGLVPAPLLVVVVGGLMNQLFAAAAPQWSLGPDQLVSLPTFDGFTGLAAALPSPEFGALGSGAVWISAVTIAVVASLETLLSVEATDALDPLKRITPTNRELRAQGVGNLMAGFLGGLPMTAVIVRSSANVASGARSKLSAIVHGIWLLLAVVFIPHLMNQIPLSALAAILLMVGFKLTRPSIYRSIWKRGFAQFIPFVVTIGTILFTDLLVGILVGIVVGLAFVVISNHHASVSVTVDEHRYLLRLGQNVSFLNKARLRNIFAAIPDGAYVIIDGTKCEFLDNDIIDVIEDFVESAPRRGTEVEVKRRHGVRNEYFSHPDSVVQKAVEEAA